MAAISTYATLGQAVAMYMARADLGVSGGNLDWFVSETEQEMNGRLRVRRMLTSVTPTVSATGVVTLPTDYAGWKRFVARDGTNEWDLALVSAEGKADISSAYTAEGIPQALVTVGSTSQIWPYDDGAYTYTSLYYGRVPALTASATTNWVVTNFPNAYLYGCLAAACRMALASASPELIPKFDALSQTWARQFDRVIDLIKREDAKDLDARSNVVLSPDTTLFQPPQQSNILSDS